MNHVNYSAVRGKTTKASRTAPRAQTEARKVASPGHQDPVWFTRHRSDFLMAVPYNSWTHAVTDVVAGIVNTLPKITGLDYQTPRVIIVRFPTKEDLDSGLSTTISAPRHP
ncbi:hypothetical protein EC991_002359 [Linnemannia zychae]|nr:hypothetical protein EC991_002359 [Linnemannia zychae]